MHEWLAEPQTKEGLRRCAVNALAAINAELSLRVPKTEQERQNAFAFWLEGYRVKIGLEGQKQFAIEFPGIFQNLSEDTIRDVVDELVWPDVESFLRSYAIRYQAGLWGRRHFGDATIYGVPVRDEDTWIVPLSVARYGNNLGRIVLDADGNVIEDLSSTRVQLLERIHSINLAPTQQHFATG